MTIVFVANNRKFEADDWRESKFIIYRLSVDEQARPFTQINTAVWRCALWSCTLTIMIFRTKEEKIGMDQAAAGMYVGIYVLYSIGYMIRVTMVRVENEERIQDSTNRWIGTSS